MNLLTVTNRRSTTDPIIQLVVSSCVGEIARLNVHRGVLCKSSEFFQNAVKPEWTTEEERVVTLPRDLAPMVTDYVKWHYHENISIELYNASGHTKGKRAAEAEKVFILLAEAYVFGERIIDAKYKNAVIETIVAARNASS